jgi:GT2 family glycosyltransferase
LVALEGKVMADRAQRHFLEESLLNLHGGLFWSCNIAILKPLFIEMNCFSEYYPHASMEDVDFRERLLQKGIKIEFVPEALIIHPWQIQDHPLGFQWKRYIAAMLLASRHEKMKKRIPPYFYFHAGIFGLAGTFLHAIHFRFRGFVKKVYIDFLQFYFAAHTLVSSVRTIK